MTEFQVLAALDEILMTSCRYLEAAAQEIEATLAHHPHPACPVCKEVFQPVPPLYRCPHCGADQIPF